MNDYSATIHTSEEFGTALAVQAQYGMMALANTLELCRRDDVSLATDSAIHVVDAFDNFEWFASRSVEGTGDFEGSEDYWLRSVELSRQLQQAAQLIAAERSGVIHLVRENRQYAVPPAIL